MRVLLLLVAIALVGCPSTTPKKETTVVEKDEKKKKKKKKKEVAVVDEPKDAPKEIGGEVVVEVIEGRAVWYGKDWHGKKTASGERFDMHKMTAAHRSLKMGTRVRVTNERNGKSVIVRINDRGPYGKDKRRIIDVSYAAAEKLDFVDAGWCPVTLEVLADDEETE
jgi:rare lipoprotein A